MSTDIATLCSSVADATVEVQAWLEDPANAELVGAEKAPLRRQLRRAALRARKLTEAASRPMCVSVFGPSQAGKSFLVSVLARPEGGKLTSNFPDPHGKLDFISQINPEGEGESTGLVTRFTVQGYDAPPGHPIKLRLLSEADLARVLANTFLMDGDRSEAEPTTEEIDRLLDTYRKRMGNALVPGLGPDDVIEIQEYLRKNFERVTYVSRLGGFWEEAIEIAPYLSIPDRAAFLAIVWGRHERFTRLYQRLAEALAQLGNPAEAFVGLEALTPREDSIIDVKLLNGLDSDGGSKLTVSTSGGRKATLPKSVVTALTAELVMPMAEKPHDLFEGTDLLDFPGARTRFERPLAQFLGEASEPLKECVLRGKVAYLFDRYVAEQEITSMLLCIPDSNMEVADLPGLIQDWIANTHGATAEQRANARTLLFFVLTKLDRHLNDSAGASDDAGSRFQRRMQASLIEKFAPLDESWPKNWAAGRPFDNCFWLRNPNYPAESVIDYDANKRELGIRQGREGRLRELREGCVNADLVRQHFKDPAVAWDAAMTLNDGGVTYLIDHLTPVCRPEIKAAQIAGQIQETAQRVSRLVSRFYVSDDLAQRLEERRAAAQALMGELVTVFEHRLFGSLLGALTVDAELLEERLHRPPANIRIAATRTAAPPPTGPSANGGIVLRGARSPSIGGGIVMPGGVKAPMRSPASSKPEEERVRTLSRPEWRGEVAFETWVEQVKSFPETENLAARYAISPQAASELAGELIATARRLHLQDRIVGALEQRAFLERGDGGVKVAAICAAELLNSFAAEAAAPLMPVEERPDVALDGASRKPFALRPQTDGIDRLPATPRRADADYLTDWMHMIYRLFEDNAMDTEGGKADPAQNLRLGATLRTLAAT